MTQIETATEANAEASTEAKAKANAAAIDWTVFQGVGAEMSNPQHKAVLVENSTFSRNVYRRGTVDYVLFDQAYVLTAETQEMLYAASYPHTPHYVAGTRIHLEQLVERLIKGHDSARARALAILAFVRDIPENYTNAGTEPFHGGTEEEIIRKGSSMCNEQARVLIVLAQIAGIPARYVGHMTPIDYNDQHSGSGHGVAELFVDGAWAYMDIRGIYFEHADGSFASTWDVICDPSLLDKQSDEACLFRRKQSRDLAGSRKYFSASSMHIIAAYAVEDHGSYDYSWVYPSKSAWNEAREKARFIREHQHRDIMPQPCLRF